MPISRQIGGECFLKILHVIPRFAPAWSYGGPVFAALGLTRELARQGHEVTVITTNINGPGVLDVPLEQPVVLDSVEVWYFQVEHPKWWCFSRSLGRTLRKAVKRSDVVHVHSIFLWPATAAAFWCRRYRVPYIVRPAGSLSPTCLRKSYDRWWVSLWSRVKKGIYLRTLGRLDLTYASVLHFTSRAEMEATGPLGLRPPGVVVPLGVDLRPLETNSASSLLREHYPQLKGKKIVLFLSRLDPIKGLNLLIAALGELARRRKDFSFVVAGSGHNAYEEEVTSLVKKHGLWDRTIFLGFVLGQAKWSLFQEVDLLVLPSYHENFGLAVVEAMAAGLPVIISNRVNIYQQIERAKAGLACDLDAKQIAAAVEKLLVDETLRRKMGQRGAVLVRGRYTSEKGAREMVRIYEQVATTAKRKR